MSTFVQERIYQDQTSLLEKRNLKWRGEFSRKKIKVIKAGGAMNGFGQKRHSKSCKFVSKFLAAPRYHFFCLVISSLSLRMLCFTYVSDLTSSTGHSLRARPLVPSFVLVPWAVDMTVTERNG